MLTLGYNCIIILFLGIDLFAKLIEKLQNGAYITLETTPPHAAKFSSIINTLQSLGLDALVDGFTTTDNPLAKLKYNSLFAAKMLQDRFKKPVIATMSMRDRNIIALQSDLLGANEADIRAILALTGDPAKMSDQPNAKGVFEGDSSLLLDIISCFNSSIDYAGKPFLLPPETIYPFAVINSYAKNPKTLQKKIHKKISKGAIGIITQPVYDLQNAELLIKLTKEANLAHPNKQDATLILGLFPITKLRTAQFLASHVPGINVPQIWLDKLRAANAVSAEEEFKVGFELSKNLFEQIKAIHPKIHLMTANQFELAKQILE